MSEFTMPKISLSPFSPTNKNWTQTDKFLVNEFCLNVLHWLLYQISVCVKSISLPFCVLELLCSQKHILEHKSKNDFFKTQVGLKRGISLKPCPPLQIRNSFLPELYDIRRITMQNFRFVRPWGSWETVFIVIITQTNSQITCWWN